MRTLVLFFVLVACVTLVATAADTVAPEAKTPEDSPAFSVEFHVSLPAGDPTPETAFSLVEDLREIPNLGYFDFQLRMRMERSPSATLSAMFNFESLPELLAWHQSDSVQRFLLSVEQASDEPVELKVRGSLAGK